MRRIIFILMALLAYTGAEAGTAKVKVTNGETTTWVDITGTINGANFTVGSSCITSSTTGTIDLNEVWSGQGKGTHYTVTSIEYAAFYPCTGLTSIEIPSSVTSIGEYAFYDCSGLTSIEIPSSVTSIGEGAFLGCSGLTEIKVQEGNTMFDSRDNCNAIIETASNTLFLGFKNTVIPETVTSIGESAFLDCSGLTSIEIPDGVTSIGKSAFEDCSGLTSIEIPSSVTSIGGDAFYGCSSLTSIEIPSSVTSIGEDAFNGCSGLTSIEIPSSVTTIGDYAFGRCSGLEEIKVGTENTVYDSRNNCNAIIETASNTLIAGCKNTVIPATVTGIGDFAFRGCSSLTSIKLPSSVISIGEGAFKECTGLTSIEIPSSVTSIGNMAFDRCSSLTSIKLPSSVTRIGPWAFYGCVNIKDVYCKATTPPSAGEQTFTNFSATLHVPAGTKKDYQGATIWENFTNIVEDLIPDGIKSIKAERSEDIRYNLRGQRIEQPKKGEIYMENGRKRLAR